jgi:hypothetical protein
VPRLTGGWLARMPQRPRIEQLGGFALSLWIAGAAAAAFAVHPVLDRWTASQAEIHDAIESHVPRAAVLIANRDALEKFIDDLGRPFLTLHRRDVSPAEIQTLLARHGDIFVALLDRSDSEFWREDGVKNAAFIEELPAASELVADLRVTSTDRLRIWRVGPPTP